MKISSKKFSLVHALLASTLMLSTGAQALPLPLIVNGLNLIGIIPILFPLDTSLLDNLLYDNNIQISPLGQLLTSVNALKIDDATRIIQIAPNNLFSGGDAIKVSGTGNGIQFAVGGNNSTLTIGSGSNINATGTGSAVVVDSLVTGIGLNNSGGIKSVSGPAIASSGAIASFANQATGLITSTSGSALSLLSGSSLPNLDNKGTISTTSLTSTVNAINSLGNITGAITNTGFITASAGSGLALLGSTLPLGSITNSGTISSGSVGSGIESAIAITGNITNNATGFITSSAGTGLNLSGGSLGGSVLNSGVISSNDVGSGLLSKITILGDIVNNGTGSITSTKGSALNLASGSSVVNLNNQGILSTGSSNSAINAVNSLGNISGAITNGGSITAVSGSALALLGASVPIGSISNSGFISSSGIGSGIESAVVISGNITNDATKTIHSELGNALNLSGGSLGGSLINDGVISANGTGSGVLSKVAIAGDILNHGTGSITSNTGNALNLSSTSSLVNLNNQGGISTNSLTSTVNAVNSLGNITGALTNSGSITAAAGTGLALLGSTLPVNSILNSGTISSGGLGSGIESAIAITGDLTNTNTGMISSTLGNALNLSGGSLGGNIVNNGTISATNVGSALLSKIAITGNLLNNAGGSIKSTSGTGLDLASGSSLVGLTNAGTILTNSLSSTVNAINSLGNISGAINNSGQITAAAGTGLALLGSTLPVANILNSGTISSNGVGSGISSLIPVSGNITNTITGMISSAQGKALNLGTGSSVVNLNNFGTITSNDTAVNAIGNITGDITNAGNINSVAGSGIALLGTLPTNSLLNNGTISSIQGTALTSAAPITGALTNSTTGIISSQTGSALNLANGSSVGSLINQGNILTNSNTNTVNALNLAGAVMGDVTNSGTISSVAGQAVHLASGTIYGALNNSNAITSLGLQPALLLEAGSDIKNGIINSGLISTGGNTAIDLSSTANSIKFINNLNGLVTGDVKLAQVAQNLDTVFEMNNGSINGIVTVAGGTGASTLKIVGGTLSGIILSANKPDVINQLGGQLGTLTGTSGQNQTLNILGNVTTSGVINNVDNLNVVSNAQLIVNDTISGLKNLMLGSNPINLPNVIQNVDFIQNLGSTLEVELKDINNFGHMVLNGANNVLNGDLKVTLSPNSVINAADEFKILDSLISPITGQINLILPISPTLTFNIKDSINGLLDLPALILVVNRIYESPLNLPGIGSALLSLLNQLGLNISLFPDVQGFTSAIDNLSSQSDVLDALSTLAPPSNGGMPDLAQRTFRKAISGVLDHLYYVDCPAVPFTAGYHPGVWTRVIGDYVRQGQDEHTLGYHSRSGGVVLGYDGYYRNHSVFGAALSYSMGTVSSHSFADQQQTLHSYQLTGYFNYDHGCNRTGYLDVAAALAFDRFNHSRDIVAGKFISTADAAYNGWHYGVDLESGYRIPLGRANKYQLIPLVNVRYSNLALNDYTETGSDLALEVQTSDIGEFVTGAGFKFRRVNKRLIPELRMNVYYDWIADAQDSTSTFIVGSDSFSTKGAEVAPLLYNIGVSLGGELKKNLILALSYDADFKSYYLGHTGSIKFKYDW